MAKVTVINYQKEIPIAFTPDILVIGGGIAGTIAACTAADHGNKVLLLESFAVLGGQGTVGGVRGFCGETSGQGHIFDEIISDLEKFGAIGPHFFAATKFFEGRKYDHEILAIVLQEVALRHKVQILFHTTFIDASINESKVDYALIAGKSGIQAIRAHMYIDCSGEADLCAAIGAPTFKGRPEDGLQLPMALNFFVRKGSRFRKKNRIPASYFPWKPIQSRLARPMTSVSSVGSTGKGIKVKIPMFDATDTLSLTDAEIACRRKMMQLLEYFQRVEHKNWELDHCSPKIGVREGRRIEGEYVLTVEDLRTGREFPDAIAVGTYVLDAHKPDDEFHTYILPKSSLKVPPYHIPLRSLIPKGISNVLLAGRNLSADQLAMSSARVMGSCAMMGHGAGVVAAYCCTCHCSPQHVVSDHMEEIHNQMRQDLCRLDLDYYSGSSKKA